MGYFAGGSIKAAEHRISLISFGILGLVVLAVAYHFLRQSEHVQRWAHGHLGFLFRLDRPIVLSVGVLVASAWLFGGLLQDVLANDGIALVDAALLDNIIAYRTSWLTGVAQVITQLGLSPFVYALLIAAGFLVWRRQRDWKRTVAALTILAFGQFVRFGIMEAVRRVRPPQELWLAQPDGFSFPSGHTTTATLGYFLIASLLWQLWPLRRVLLFTGAGVLALAVGLSRVYLGVHWPSDILASWSLGIAWLSLAALAVLSLRFWKDRGKSPTEGANPKR